VSLLIISVGVAIVKIMPKKCFHHTFVCVSIKMWPHVVSPREHTIIKNINGCPDSPFFPGVRCQKVVEDLWSRV
jgi:hypothetical protein